MKFIKLLLSDLDNTIRRPKSGATFINDPKDQEVIAEAAAALARYHNDGWTVIGITNQGGCSAINPKTARPYKTIEDAIVEQEYTLELVPGLEAIYFCPDFEGKQCWKVTREISAAMHGSFPNFTDFRKPGSGMLRLAMFLEVVMLEDTIYISDRPEDEQAAADAKVKFLWASDWYQIAVN